MAQVAPAALPSAAAAPVAAPAPAPPPPAAPAASPAPVATAAQNAPPAPATSVGVSVTTPPVPPAQATGAEPIPAPPPAPEVPPLPPEPDPTRAAQASAAPPVSASPASTTVALDPIKLEPPSVEEPQVSEPEERWYDAIELAAFADVYGSVNYALTQPQSHRNRFRAFDTANGFSVSWAGLNLNYEGDVIGGEIDLRVGPSATALAGADAEVGLQFLQQAYVTWKPYGKKSKLTVDFGKFNTIYGAEAPESQLNFNYTRGLLYSLGQPYFHTGLRASIDFSDDFWMTLLAVNGWNRSVDNNLGKSFGLQFSYSVPSEGRPLFDAHLGYLMGPETRDFGLARNFCAPGSSVDVSTNDCQVGASGPNELPYSAQTANSALRHFVDLVLGFNPSDSLSFLLNADLAFDSVRNGALDFDSEGTERVDPPGFRSTSWWGVSLMGRSQVAERFALALRGEVFGDPDGRTNDDPFVSAPDVTLYSGTLTAEYAPAPSLLMRLDNRLDAASEEVFPVGVRSYASTQFTTTLGLVLTTP